MKCVFPCPGREAVTQALQAVLGYLWDDEAADYHARTPQEKRGHIFSELAALQAWLSATQKMLDKSYHTMAPRCLQAMRFTSEVFAASLFAVFTRARCVFAKEMRLAERRVHVTTYVANSRGAA